MNLLGKIKTMLRMKNYEQYNEPYKLNIVGIRNATTKPNRFDDEIHVFFKTQKGGWEHYIFTATTDPGTFWLKDPMRPEGTAILKAGQYVDTWSIDWHRGKYLALCQRKPVTVIRDYNRDAILDFYNGEEHTGLFGINIHRAMKKGKTKYVDEFSAGCQVFEDGENFELFMRLCERHRQMYGNKFTYTLFDHRAVKRATRRRWAIGLTAGTLAVVMFVPRFREGIIDYFTQDENGNTEEEI